MKSRAIINFHVNTEKKAKYKEASKEIGTSMSEICRRALDASVDLAEKLKTLKTSKPTGEKHVDY